MSVLKRKGTESKCI